MQMSNSTPMVLNSLANNPSRELNWLDLPNHVLLLITDKLITQIQDYIRFGAVCKSWRSVYTHNLHWYRNHLPLQLPLLMLSTTDDIKHRSLYSLTENKIYNYPLAVPHSENCCSSTQGWLVTVYNGSEVRLLNPCLTVNNVIELPPISAFEPRGKVTSAVYLNKVVLSANPTSNSNYIAIAIYSRYCRLAFFKPGNKNWISFNTNHELFEDVIYYNDQFHAINYFGEVFTCDVNPSNPVVSKIIERPSVNPYADKRYLVESNGGLLQILKTLKNEVGSARNFLTGEFKVYRLDPVELKWLETKNLLGRMLFLGRNSSMSLLASDFAGCKPNSIYFTDDYFGGYHMKLQGPYDMGVFDIEDGSLKPHYPTAISKLSPPPIWILPRI
ncbi:F-box skip23-like protein [Thalictrum thalictroides]|uniref:F-box skip23-like protein n=1 Tax=Thalictrum thalictroides TaxID=46969 RepID=A0A7J6VW77_THATH|nr:F-box skip23-like protein [Thalictrum thalictroides]